MRSRVVFLAPLILAVSGGCAIPIDMHRRHLVTAGAGAATLNPGAPIEGAPEGALEFGSVLSTHAAYSYRLTPPDPPVAVFASAVTQFVRGASVDGGGLSQRCELNWAVVGPAVRVQGPAHAALSFSGDFGVAAVHLSRPSCGRPDQLVGQNAASTTVSPLIGFAIEFGLTERVGWSLGGWWMRAPLDKVGLPAESRWAGAGALSVLVAF